jgi:glycosyltransferase involved in cell wall biosynthesis
MIKVGLTELHGIAKEVMENPPQGVVYKKANNSYAITRYVFKSHVIGILDYFKGEDCDLLEAPLFPILTNKPWLYTPARFSGATAFTLLGIPLPRFLRIYFIKRLMLRDNFLKLIFKSQAGARTLESYAKITDKRILDKVEVVYPCMREVEDRLIRYNENKINFMFSGDFFLKGGANVVDAFERLQKKYSNIHLRICSLPDLRIKNTELRQIYERKISSNPHITFGHVDRKQMLEEVLPDTDVFVSPTYQEAFGFAILEASAYGIPVISTNHFAIPEIIRHGHSGFLIETDHFKFIRNGKVCVLKDIPEEFHVYMSNQVFHYMDILAKDGIARKEMGKNGLAIARTKFSFEQRNKKMKKIYEDGLKCYASRKTT